MPNLTAAPPVTHDAAGAPMIRWQPLGASIVRVGTARVDPTADLAFAILLRLSFTPGMRVARDTLLGELWPGLPAVRQRGNLRQALYKLRGGGVRVELRGDEVRLDPAQLVPVFALERSSERFAADVTLGHEPFGAFLPGYAPALPAIAEFAARVRESMHADIRRVLVEQLRARRERADWSGAHALARWLLQFDPLNEDATLTHAECMAMNGSKAEAVAILDAYLAELGPHAGDIRLPATLLRRRITESKPLARRNLAPTERHFIGREELMAELTATMRRAKWRDGSVTLLHGPPGMGKSRVLQELAKVAALEGFQVISVACRESDQPRSLAVFLDVVTELLELPGAMGCDPGTMRVLNRFARMPAITSDSSESSSSEEVPYFPTPSALRRAIVDLIMAVCHEAPVCLQVDDVHWLDNESGKLIGELCGATDHRVFTLLSSRLETTAWLSSSERRTLSRRRLPPLAANDASALAEAIAEDVALSVSQEANQWIVETAEGNPLYLRALLSHWMETGVARDVPRTLSELIDVRLSGLSAEALYALQTIALLGKRASVVGLRHVLGMAMPTLLGALDELSRHFAVRIGDDGQIGLHDLVQRSALNRISEVSFLLLHQRVSDFLRTEVLPTDDSAAIEVVASLGQSKAFVQLESAAESIALELTRKGRPLLAVSVCDEAKRFLDASQYAQRVRVAHIQALMHSGHHERVLAEFPIPTGRVLGGPETDAEANELLSALESSRYSLVWDDYRDHTAQAVLIAESINVSADVRFRAACIALRLASYHQIQLPADRALAAGRACVAELGHAEERNRELDMYYHAFFGDYTTALRAAREIVSKPPQYLRLESERLMVLGQAHYALRIVGSAQESYQLSLQLGSRAEQRELFGLASSCFRNASSYLIDSDFQPEEAMRLLDRALPLARRTGNPFHIWIVLETAAKLEVLRSDAQGVERILGELSSHVYGTRVPLRQAARSSLWLAYAVLRHDTARVKEMIPALSELLDRVVTQPSQGFFAYTIARGYQMLDRPSEARDTLARFRRAHLRPEPIPWYVESISAELGEP